MVNPVLIERDTMVSIGNAIRNKGGATTPLAPGQMPAAINSISGGSVEPCIISASYLVGNFQNDNGPHNDWDKVKDLIDYENATCLTAIFAKRKDLTIREVEEFFSHSMPNVKNLENAVLNTNYIDSDIATHVFDLTLDSPNCTNYDTMFSGANIKHLKLTIPNHNRDFTMTYLCHNCYVTNLEIKGSGLNHLTSLAFLCNGSSFLKTATIGDDNTDYSKIQNTKSIFTACRSLKILTIKGINVLPLASGSSIPPNIQSIKVPAALVNTYKNATNWATFADKISAI